MKLSFFAVLLTVSAFYGSSSEDPILKEPSDLQEIALLDSSTISQDTISLEETQLPVPEFKLQKSVYWATALSALCPGMGHFYLGEPKTGSTIMGSAGVGAGLLAYRDKSPLPGAVTLLTAWNYGVYAAYRDARNYNGQANFSYSMPQESFSDLAKASFQWSVIKKPEVWGGLLGSLALAIGVSYVAYNNTSIIPPLSSAIEKATPLLAFPVGIGEESFFRGFLQSALLEKMPPWTAISLSSLTFGAAHLSNASNMEKAERRRYYTFSIPLITTLGAYFGYLTYKNGSLKESVALHAWYDFVLFGMGVLADKAASIGGQQNFAIAIPF